MDDYRRNSRNSQFPRGPGLRQNISQPQNTPGAHLHLNAHGMNLGQAPHAAVLRPGLANLVYGRGSRRLHGKQSGPPTNQHWLGGYWRGRQNGFPGDVRPSQQPYQDGDPISTVDYWNHRQGKPITLKPYQERALYQDADIFQETVPTQNFLVERQDRENAARQLRFNQLSPQEKTAQSAWVEAYILKLPGCPSTQPWARFEGGYRCQGGHHFMTDAQIARGQGGYYRAVNKLMLGDDSEVWKRGNWTRGPPDYDISEGGGPRWELPWEGPLYGLDQRWETYKRFLLSKPGGQQQIDNMVAGIDLTGRT